MNPHSAVLSPTETAGALTTTDFTHEQGLLRARFSTGDFMGAVRLLERVAAVAEQMNHHPDVSLSYGSITFELSSHDAGGVTERDVSLAVQIQQLADAQ